MKTSLSQDKPPTKRIVVSPRRRLLGVALALAFSVLGVKGFSLLGPYADWMQPTNGYRLPYDIGGPMAAGEEYRWNVPVVTYAFDQSFLDYFGSNGVAAVEQAIQVLNDLLLASGIVLTNYPLESKRVNFHAYALAPFLHKSLEQAGGESVSKLEKTDAYANTYHRPPCDRV